MKGAMSFRSYQQYSTHCVIKISFFGDATFQEISARKKELQEKIKQCL